MRLELLSVIFEPNSSGIVTFDVADDRSDLAAPPLLKGEARFAICRRKPAPDYGAETEVVTLRGDPETRVVVTFEPPTHLADEHAVHPHLYRRHAAILIANIAVNGRLSTSRDAPPIVVLGRR